jgi:Pyridoxamine 5'-phosphate oxidase.
MSGKLMEYFNRSPRIGTLSTADAQGRVDTAVFGSPRMIDDRTVIMGLGKNRTFANLVENPYAVFLIIEPGKALMDWKGVRVYLKMTSKATSGPQLESYKNQIAQALGKEAANMIYATVTFEVTEIRPLVDFGQGWENSI